MQLATAQKLVSQLLAEGYSAWATQLTDGEWQVSTTTQSYVDEQTTQLFAGGLGAKVQSYNVATSVVFV